MSSLLQRRFIFLFELLFFLIPAYLGAQEAFGGSPKGLHITRIPSSRVIQIVESATDAESVLSW